MAQDNLLTKVEREGQPYVDEPVYTWPRPEFALRCKEELSEAAIAISKFVAAKLAEHMASEATKQPMVTQDDPMDEVRGALEGLALTRQPILLRHERVKLKWMKPGPDGKLIPKVKGTR